MAAVHWQRLISDLQFYTTRLLNFQFEMYGLGWQPVIQPILASNTVKTRGQKKEHLANVLGLQQQERELMISMLMSEITCCFCSICWKHFQNISIPFNCGLAQNNVENYSKRTEELKQTEHKTESVSLGRTPGPTPPNSGEGWNPRVRAGRGDGSSLCYCTLFLGVAVLSFLPDSE